MTEARQQVWYVANADGEVIAGPFSDEVAARRLAESFGPDHIALPGALLPAVEASPSRPA